MAQNFGVSDQYGPFINNEFRPITGESFPAVNAGTGEHLADLARCGAEQIDEAVAAAKAAFPAWKATMPEDRSAMLNKLADAIEENQHRLAVIDAMDIGRKIPETALDHQFAINQYRYFAAAAITHEGWGRPIPEGYLVAKREPYGVCGQIIPWNVPGIMAAFKIAPAVAAGNTVVLKPDENASLSTLELGKLIAEIFPPGVINILPGMGEEAGSALTGHPDVAKLAFTGSTEVGKIIATAGAQRITPVSLELGGKSPNIVFPDVEKLDAVVDNVAFAATYCNGQSCLAGTRLFVHDDIYEEFMRKLVDGFERLSLGPATDDTSNISGMVSAEQGERVLGYIKKGIDEGAKLLTGGKRVAIEGYEHGYFIEPTILETTNDSTIAQEEIFGPVLSVIRWNDHDKMIKEANDIRYGLAAGVYTSDLKNAMETADRLEAGSVWINSYFNLASGAPFGGYKESGIGSEFSHETLNMYTKLKSVTIQNEPSDAWFLPEN